MYTGRDVEAWLHSTHEEPDERQFAIWRRMTSAQKLHLAFSLYDFAKDLVRLHLRNENPTLTEAQIAELVRQRFTTHD
jgi:hypothetical protein